MPIPDWYRELLDVSEVFASTDHAEVVAWRGDSADESDVPPFTIRLAALGRALAERSAELTPEQSRETFRSLEMVMTSSSEHDRTAVATGFLEALLHAWDRGFDLQGVWPFIGPESRNFCREYNAFGGIDTPGWMR